ncbi:hypothetical protein SMCF_58 [Streptomyces coelicoflavus ZG0656]|nr:hypothetical protein SMCF_58 [Streptomyces coelicoflavus ZG0656]MZE45791.1 hypothetical protein [Streptomyces sp. SID5477]
MRHIAGDTQLPAALKALGTRASAQSTVTGLLTTRRTSGRTDSYFVHNPGPATASTHLSLEGTGHPHTLDAWTGSNPYG